MTGVDQGQAPPPPDWYRDPAGNSSLERFWDGGRWTEYTRAVGTKHSDPAEGGAFAEIEVARQFSLWMGIALTWDVYVDNSLVGTCKNGKTIRFQIQPGWRTLIIWSQRRKACSNVLQLDAQPGTVRHLHCRINKAQLRDGMWGSYRQRWNYQKQIRNQIREAGGVNREGILLYEDQWSIPTRAADT
jgi:hypothetical protein